LFGSGYATIWNCGCFSDLLTFFSDWACGGQWNRMVQFLAVLIQTVQTSHIELAVFFNGCLEQQRMTEWITSQQDVRKKINQVQICFNNDFWVCCYYG
jgi:hypothetical protein